MNKSYFIFRIEWSASDTEMVIIRASSAAEAEAYLRRSGANGPRYIQLYREVKTIIEI